MDKVMYRNLQKDDYEIIKNLIDEAFGFYEFIDDKRILDLVLTIYLQECIFDSSYSKVAVLNNQVVGIILGKANNDKNKIRNFKDYANIISTGAKLIFVSNEYKKGLREFKKIQDVYEEIIKGRKQEFQGCIQLFIVSKKCRGLGIGKTLVKNLFNYMKEREVKNLYLYTDTRCNFGFYDSHNFKRLREEKVEFNSIKESLTVYLYGFNLGEIK